MLYRHGRQTLAPVVVLLLASSCTPNARKTADRLRHQVRSQQHVIDGQTRQIRELTAERNTVRAQFEEQNLLLKVFQDKASSAEEILSKVAVEKDDLQRRLEELAREDPDAFQYDQKTGTLSVAAEILFSPGKTDLRKSGVSALKKVVAALEGSDQLIRVDGHTDADPIKVSKWEDNWQLAAERARRVLKLLVKEGIGKERLYFAAFADTRPKSANTSLEGKRTNRRVEIVPLDEERAPLPTTKVSKSN